METNRDVLYLIYSQCNSLKARNALLCLSKDINITILSYIKDIDKYNIGNISLTPQQVECVDAILKSNSFFRYIQAPLSFGKTYVLLTIALMLIKKYNKSVVISVPSSSYITWKDTVNKLNNLNIYFVDFLLKTYNTDKEMINNIKGVYIIIQRRIKIKYLIDLDICSLLFDESHTTSCTNKVNLILHNSYYKKINCIIGASADRTRMFKINSTSTIIKSRYLNYLNNLIEEYPNRLTKDNYEYEYIVNNISITRYKPKYIHHILDNDHYCYLDLYSNDQNDQSVILNSIKYCLNNNNKIMLVVNKKLKKYLYQSLNFASKLKKEHGIIVTFFNKYQLDILSNIKKNNNHRLLVVSYENDATGFNAPFIDDVICYDPHQSVYTSYKQILGRVRRITNDSSYINVYNLISFRIDKIKLDLQIIKIKSYMLNDKEIDSILKKITRKTMYPSNPSINKKIFYKIINLDKIDELTPIESFLLLNIFTEKDINNIINIIREYDLFKFLSERKKINIFRRNSKLIERIYLNNYLKDNILEKILN